MNIFGLNIEETILFEDKDIIVCRKPGGIPVQTRRSTMMDMESGLKNYLAKKGEDPYLAVVHRLDQPVQGILVFGKNIKHSIDLGIRDTYADISATILDIFNYPKLKYGDSFKDLII